MKTIFDKINPEYLNHATQGVKCTTGTCEHPVHKVNTLTWLLPIIIACIAIYRVNKLYRR